MRVPDWWKARPRPSTTDPTKTAQETAFPAKGAVPKIVSNQTPKKNKERDFS